MVIGRLSVYVSPTMYVIEDFLIFIGLYFHYPVVSLQLFFESAQFFCHISLVVSISTA